MMRGNNGQTEMVITADKNALLDKLKNNKNAHVEEYNQACIGYRLKLIEAAKKATQQLAVYSENLLATVEGATPDAMPETPALSLHRSQPITHEKDYDRAIQMLTMHTGDTLMIDMSTYRQYVDDEWEWAAGTKAVNSGYAVGHAGAAAEAARRRTLG